MKIAVLGAGSWGTVLAKLLAENKHKVILWGRSSQAMQKLAATHINADYLPEVELPAALTYTADLAQAVTEQDLIVLAVPAKAMRQTCQQLRTFNTCEHTMLVSCAKGFDPSTGQRMSEVIAEELPANTALAVLSGPNLSKEIAREEPAATVIATSKPDLAQQLQEVFNAPYFRPYASADVLGVELCGCLKNAVAIVSGMMHGCGYGENAQAALVTRGLAEISRLGQAMGAYPETFAGLAGIGDLIATCTSSKSRNRSAGVALAQGKSVEEIQTSSSMVIEGIATVPLTIKLAKKYGVEMPIIEQLAFVLAGDRSVQEAVALLMQRHIKKE